MRGIIVCPQPRAADIGADILEAGGNAFDAFIATGFAQMVVDPFQCGVGGFGLVTYFDASQGSGVGAIDFHTRAGSKVTDDMWAADFRGVTEISNYTLFDDHRGELGYTAIMTPGLVAGFWETHQRFGTLPWEQLVMPAATMAREGMQMTPTMHHMLGRKNQAGLPDGKERVSKTEACRKIWLGDRGEFLHVGEWLKNPDYGDTLEAIARGGADEFYRGELGRRIAEDLEANGSYVTADDLANYTVRTPTPVAGTYRGYEVHSSNPPASGTVLVQMLNILEHFDLASMGHNSPEYLDLLARTMSAAHTDRMEFLTDPDFHDVPVEMICGAERAAELAERIKAGEAFKFAKQKPEQGTTQVVVYDEAGNAVSCTHTLGSASGVVTPGLGFTYNNSMKLGDPIPGRIRSFAPGKARYTGSVPTILLKDGKPFMIAGAPGGSVVISATLQAILNVIDFGMSPLEAVTVPRMHCEGQAVHLDFHIQRSTARAIEAMGHEIRQEPISNLTYGRPFAITIDADGRWRGGSDPRGEAGMAQVL